MITEQELKATANFVNAYNELKTAFTRNIEKADTVLKNSGFKRPAHWKKPGRKPKSAKTARLVQ